MFTGLVEEIGSVTGLQPLGRGRRIAVRAPLVCDGSQIGDSIAVNGVCLTVVELKPPVFTVQAVEESLQRSNLGEMSIGEPVNLERSLRADGRFGGHFVQGHIDGTGVLMALERREPGYWLRVRTRAELLQLCVEKGSIALDGVSLTIAELSADQFTIALIPHTAESTTLGNKTAGNTINIEVDILGKYIHRFMHSNPKNSAGLDLSKLADWGYEP